VLPVLNSQWPLGIFGRVSSIQNNEYHTDRFQGPERLGVSTEECFKEKREMYGHKPFNEDRED
jgi:hypothetical protein